MNLEQLQRTMLASVILPLTANEGMRERNAAGEPMEAVAGRFIRPNDRLTAFERLEIYNRQYWFRVQGAFQEDFPALRGVLGAERFEALANAYLQAHPSRSFTLRNLGSHLVDWLSANPAWAGRRIALALDVARVEWACVEAFDGAEFAPLTLAEIAGLDADSRLGLQPHLRLLALKYPADDLVLAMHQKQRREASEAGTRGEETGQTPEERIRLLRRATWLAVHRVDFSLYYKRLTRPEYRTLLAIGAGRALPEALERGFDGARISPANQIQAVRAWFTHWAELGWLCRADAGSKEQ